jgi:predicted acetyltransferase
MDVELRYATDAEWAAVAELDGASFGFHYSAEELVDARLDLDPARILVADHGGRIVAVSGELAFEMTLPGGGRVPTTGLSWVSVELTHRRRGILRALMERQLRDAAATGRAAVILSAAEGGIYGRYGFGVATSVRRAVVSRRRARISRPVDTSAVQRVTTDVARDRLPALYDRWRRQSPGGVNRDERRWKLTLLDRESQREGRSGLFHLVHPDGYVSYRIKPNWGNGDPQHECHIVDYAPVSDEAHAALWQVLLSMDLVGTIASYRVPIDDPLPFLLDDPRGIDTTHVGDNLWVRPTDVVQLLGGRRYGVDVDVVLEVRDGLLGDGRYLLQAGPDGAECARTDRPADVTVAVGDLGALSLGGLRLSRLVRAGRVGVDDSRRLARLDLALLADREPAHGTQF